MAHHFSFTVDVTVERISGKFATRSDIADAIREALESGANDAYVSGIGDDGNSEYEVTDVTVDEVDKR